MDPGSEDPPGEHPPLPESPGPGSAGSGAERTESPGSRFGGLPGYQEEKTALGTGAVTYPSNASSTPRRKTKMASSSCEKNGRLKRRTCLLPLSALREDEEELFEPFFLPEPRAGDGRAGPDWSPEGDLSEPCLRRDPG